jgi:hypothetical protein
VKSESSAIAALKKSVEILVGDLGAGGGINNCAYEEICGALRFLAVHYRGKQVVSRDMVLHVYGLVGLMLGVCERYGVNDANEIQSRAAALDELILACFADPE